MYRVCHYGMMAYFGKIYLGLLPVTKTIQHVKMRIEQFKWIRYNKGVPRKICYHEKIDTEKYTGSILP